MNVQRRWLFPIAVLIFLLYAGWNAHTPGQPRTVKDFLFVLEVFAIPFGVFVYAVSSSFKWQGIAAVGDGVGLRHRIAILGSVLGSASAALLLLFLPLWSIAVDHPLLQDCWLVAGVLMSVGAVLCGMVGAPKLRRPGLFSIALLPFWGVLATLLLKATMD